MGYRCPVSFILLGLAMAWGQAGSRRVPAAPPNSFSAPTADEQATNPPLTARQGPDFLTQNRSHLRLDRGDRVLDIYLFAPDETGEVLKAPYCGGNAGAKQFSGHYQLLSAAGNTVISRLDLGPDYTFVEKKPHDGLRLLHDPRSSQDLFALYQYENCNSESVQFFSVDPSGQLFMIAFLDHDGRTWKQMLTGPDGAIPQAADGALTFCSYVNTLGSDFCEKYAFDGANFLEAAKWMTQETASAAKTPTDLSLAERALFEFLSTLSAKEYAAAAYYLHPSVVPGGTSLPATDNARRAAFLEDYCTVSGGQCFMPVKLAARPTTDPPTVLRFQVSLQDPDFQPVKIGSSSTFDFRVARTATGYKVLDLPPRLPTGGSKQ